METLPGEPWRTTVHSIQPRDGGDRHDVIPEICGVIDHVNRERALLHFVVDREINGTFPLSEFQGAAEPGVAVAIRMASHQSRNGTRTRVISMAPTDRAPDNNIFQKFRDTVEIRNNGIGFTMNGIFIPPDLVASTDMAYGDEVQGIAVINYDKKKKVWGWKAIKTQKCA